MKTNLEKIKDLKSVINSFYHSMKCDGELTNDARGCWLLYQKYCEDLIKELDEYERLKKAVKNLDKSLELIWYDDGLYTDKEIYLIELKNPKKRYEEVDGFTYCTIKRVWENE